MATDRQEPLISSSALIDRLASKHSVARKRRRVQAAECSLTKVRGRQSCRTVSIVACHYKRPGGFRRSGLFSFTWLPENGHAAGIGLEELLQLLTAAFGRYCCPERIARMSAAGGSGHSDCWTLHTKRVEPQGKVGGASRLLIQPRPE